MEYQEFSTIYKALKSRSSDNNLNKDNVVEEIQGKLQNLDKNSDAYKKWKEGNFSLDHVFTTVNDRGLESKHTLLTTAFNCADLEMANFLIKVGADVNAVGVDGLTPLIIAIEKKFGNPINKALVDLLIEEAKADVNTAGADGMTPISKAVERGDLETFKALVKNGANVNIQVYGMSLLKWAESHQLDPVINKEDMEGIINALSEEKGQKDPEIATSTNIDNLKQTDEAESTIPTVPDETSSEISPEERNAECALQCQIEEIVLSDGKQHLPENNSTNLPNEKSDLSGTNPPVVPTTTGTSRVSATSNTLPAPTIGNKTPEKNDTTFWSEHKGKIALGVTGLCVAGAVAAYVLAYPAVALALTVLAAVILIGAGIAKFCEKSESPNTKSSDPVVSGCCNNAELPNQ